MRMWLLNNPWAAKLCQQWWIKRMDSTKVPISLGLELSQGPQCRGIVIKKCNRQKYELQKLLLLCLVQQKILSNLLLLTLCGPEFYSYSTNDWSTKHSLLGDHWNITMAKKLGEKLTRIWILGCATWWPEDVYDTFEAHLTENVKGVFTKGNINLGLIPKRLTSAL